MLFKFVGHPERFQCGIGCVDDFINGKKKVPSAVQFGL